MEFDHRSIPLDRIDDTDGTFRISFGDRSRLVRSSIRCVGLTNPPLLLAKEDGYVIVSGFARIAACRELGWHSIPARCLPADIPISECALLAIADNAGQRELNIVERARAFALITRYCAKKDDPFELLRSLGLAVGRDWIQKLDGIMQMPQRLQNALADGAVALPVAMKLSGLSESGAAEALTELFQELRLGMNRQRELLEWIESIALREDLRITDILHQDPIARWRRDVKDRGHAALLIRQHLRRRRYPEICAFEERYARHLEKLNLPPEIQIEPPPHFEGRTFHLRLAFQDTQALSSLNQAIRRMLESPHLSELLGLSDNV